MTVCMDRSDRHRSARHGDAGAARSQPASNVSASGAGAAKRPATRNTANPSVIAAPAPPSSSGTQVSGSPDSSSASHSAFGHVPFSASLIVVGSHRSWKIRVAVSTMMLSVVIGHLAPLRPEMLPILEQGESDGKSPAEPREVAPLFPLLFTGNYQLPTVLRPQKSSIADGQRMRKQ